MLEDIILWYVEMVQKLIVNNVVDIVVEEILDFIYFDLIFFVGENCCCVVVKGIYINVVEFYINGQLQLLSEKQNMYIQCEMLFIFLL